MNEKVLVCITAQSNSRRLIDKGAALSDTLNGELNILHVIKGNNIFHRKDSEELIHELFVYGTEKDGNVYAISGEDVVETIINFILENDITKIVVGENPKRDVVQHSIFDVLGDDVEVIVLERE